MTKILVALALVLPLTLSAATVGADNTKLSAKESACAKARKHGKTCVISFGQGDDIDGGTVSPDGIDVITRTPTLFGGLIQVRTDFRDRIIAQVEDL